MGGPNRTAEIRGLLQTRALSVNGFPEKSKCKFDGVLFDPATVINEVWARMVLMTNSRQPIGLRSSDSKLNGGIFLIDVFGPPNKGSADVDNLADAVVDAFKPGELIVGTTVKLWIPTSYRGGVMESADEIQVPVTVSWRCVTD